MDIKNNTGLSIKALGVTLMLCKYQDAHDSMESGQSYQEGLGPTHTLDFHWKDIQISSQSPN